MYCIVAIQPFGCYTTINFILRSFVNRALVNCQASETAEYVRVRSFSTSSRGVKNRGDSFKLTISESTSDLEILTLNA